MLYPSPETNVTANTTIHVLQSHREEFNEKLRVTDVELTTTGWGDGIGTTFSRRPC
jgi:hypothetical protein